MITTNKISVILSKGKLKSRQVTTKDINPGVRVEPPKEPIKTRSVSTTTLPDVADIIEKKRRDGIMAKLEKAKKEAKAKATAKAKKAAKAKTPPKPEKVVDVTKPPETEEVVKMVKPWNKMNSAERKEYQRIKKEKK